MTGEFFPGQPEPRIIIIEAAIRPMTMELARDVSLLSGRFFNEFLPADGNWHNTSRLRRDVTDEDLQRARQLARLDEVDMLMSEGYLSAKSKEEKKSFYSPTDDQRLYTWLRYMGKCRYCKVNISPDYFEMDHYKPFSNGGMTITHNLVCSCKKCNRAKNQDEGEAFDRLAQHPNFKLYRDAMYWDRKESIPPYLDKTRISKLVVEASIIMYPQG